MKEGTFREVEDIDSRRKKLESDPKSDDSLIGNFWELN